ncbi:FecR domain-containing protein [Sphingobium sp.]|uniref:FecR family protein n=1 Tax=Sphingobium sp. TaxID=1912891 RepID=UPI0028BE8FBE|nr:FecR domain-containing protein [Sphingobium sp.]
MTAQSNLDERVLDEALAWQAALERDDADWDGYMAWLEADPRHRQAFDSIALTTAMVEEHKDAVGSLFDVQGEQAIPRPHRRMKWALGVGIVAVLALAIGLPLRQQEPAPSVYAADAGKSRAVALANGANILLSPASRIVVHGKDAARIELASGEAFFAVRHDPSRMLTIEAGPYRIIDIGTRFSVNLSGGTFRVGVSEGAVAVASDKAEGEVRLQAGQQLTGGANGDLTLAPVAVADVGSWRAGRLSYSDAPLALVVADISRYSGKRVIIDPSLETRHFSGTLVIGDGSRLLPDLATVMGVAVHSQAGGAVRLGGADR